MKSPMRRHPSALFPQLVGLLLLGGLVVMCGLGAYGLRSANELVGTAWTLVELGDPAAPTPARYGQHIKFGAQTATGSNGCNNYSTDYLIDGAQLVVLGATATFVDCTTNSAPIRQDGQYMALLLAAEQVTRADGRLTLTGPQGVLVFRRGLPDPTTYPASVRRTIATPPKAWSWRGYLGAPVYPGPFTEWKK